MCLLWAPVLFLPDKDQPVHYKSLDMGMYPYCAIKVFWNSPEWIRLDITFYPINIGIHLTTLHYFSNPSLDKPRRGVKLTHSCTLIFHETCEDLNRCLYPVAIL